MYLWGELLIIFAMLWGGGRMKFFQTSWSRAGPSSVQRWLARPIEAVFHWGHLAFCSSSIEVVFLWCHFSLRSFSIVVVIHWGSLIEVVLCWEHCGISITPSGSVWQLPLALWTTLHFHYFHGANGNIILKAAVCLQATSQCRYFSQFWCIL